MKIKYLGHSCFLFQINGIEVIIDPFISPNDLASQINVDDLSPKYILLSHGHEDHVADALELATKNNATIVSNFEVTQWFHKKGVKHFHPMNYGGSWEFEFGKVTMVSAVHSSSMPDGSYGGNPAGFIIETHDKTLYYAGDTALTLDMQLLGNRYSIDVAFLPIGGNFTMEAEDAVTAANFVGCDKIIGMHFDTFDFIKIDHNKLMTLFKDDGKELTIPSIGDEIIV